MIFLYFHIVNYQADRRMSFWPGRGINSFSIYKALTLFYAAVYAIGKIQQKGTFPIYRIISDW